MGFFDAQLDGGDTLNPIQREFVRLAQIFKSRLVTELELNQRIKERGLIEDRIGDTLTTLREQDRREREAKEQLRVSQAQIAASVQKTVQAVEGVLFSMNIDWPSFENEIKKASSGQEVAAELKKVQDALNIQSNAKDALNTQSNPSNTTDGDRLDEMITFYKTTRSEDLESAKERAFNFLKSRSEVNEQAKRVREMLIKFMGEDFTSFTFEDAFNRINKVMYALSTLSRNANFKNSGDLANARASLQELTGQLIKLRFARDNLAGARRPLNHKKLLDMLIDDSRGEVHRAAGGDPVAHGEHRRLHQGRRHGARRRLQHAVLLPGLRRGPQGEPILRRDARRDRDDQRPGEQPLVRQGRADRRRWSSTCPSATSSSTRR